MLTSILQKETPVVFANGHLKPGVDKEPPNKQKKWAVPASAQGNAIYIPDQYVSAYEPLKLLQVEISNILLRLRE